MKKIIILIALVLISLTVIASFALNQQKVEDLPGPADSSLTKTNFSSGNMAILEDLRAMEMQFNGIPYDSLPWDQLTPLKDAAPAPTANYSLTLIYSMIGCNTCLAKQLSYIRSLTSQPGLNVSVQVVILRGRREDTLRFKRIYRLDAPFYSDQDQVMANTLNLQGRMLILLSDNYSGRVLSAHVPHPSMPDRSDDFGKYVLRLAGLVTNEG